MKFSHFRLKMSSDREQNGPTQIHPSLNYNEMNTHIQLNGMNGMNGITGKSFGEFRLITI
jgi:hypothetical protein